MAKASNLPPKLYCCGCGRLLDNKEFYENYEPHHLYSRMHYCKDCCKTISADIMSKNANFELCTRNMCIFFDVPFTYEAMEQFKLRVNSGTKDRDVSYLFNYLKALDEVGVPKEYWQDLSGASFFGIDLLKVAKPTSEGDIELLEYLRKSWGKQDKIEDYLWLEDEYFQYAQGAELTPAAVNTLRYLCLTELSIKNGKDKGEDTTKLEDKVLKYLKTLGLDSFNVSGDRPKWKETIEDFAYIYEHESPIEWAETKAEDICRFREDNNEIMRCIGNKVLGSKQYPEITLEDLERLKK